jgi:hypothetical protein
MGPSFRPYNNSSRTTTLIHIFLLLVALTNALANSRQPPSIQMTSTPTYTPLSQQDPADLSTWGNALAFEKPLNSMRLICQNPYGLDASTNYRKLDLFAQNMAAYQADIGCLPETNADWKQPTVLRQCHSALRKHLKHHPLITSCSDAVARHSYLSGGTATIAANNWTGRIASPCNSSDGLG